MILQEYGLSISRIWHWLMDNLIIINLILSIVIVFFQRKDPKTVWTWLLALYFIPVFGIFFYIIFGQDMRKSKMFRIKEVEDKLTYPVKRQEEQLRQFIFTEEDSRRDQYGDLVMYNLQTGGAVYTTRNQIEIFYDGRDKFHDLIETMANAKAHIHIQYYIIKNDELFHSMMPVLKKKVSEGVEVRILYDGMGGRFMPKKVWQELKAAGVKVGAFFPPVLGRLNFRVNYRNHRKIVVIDGAVSYVGGFNIGREYLGLDPRFGYWRDTHLKIHGDAAISLQIRFALDWNYAVKENLFLAGKYFEPAGGAEIEEKYLASEGVPARRMPLESPAEGGGAARRMPLGIQIIASGPDQPNRQIRDNYLELFNKAKHHIYIQTPYFVPDDAILSALKIAALSGVDVRLMVPCKPDHPFVYWATYSYIGDLLDSGVRSYTYENGFLHSKGVMVDGEVSCYGTANMDIRSFELNFEVNAVIYDREATKLLEAAFIRDLETCREVTRAVYESRSLLVRLKEQCCRLLSPLL